MHQVGVETPLLNAYRPRVAERVGHRFEKLPCKHCFEKLLCKQNVHVNNPHHLPHQKAILITCPIKRRM